MEPITVTLRGQLLTVVDVETFEDRSVGIGWHVENFRLLDATGAPVDFEPIDDELVTIDDAVWNAQAEVRLAHALYEEEGL